jgi:hypothetical protein
MSRVSILTLFVAGLSAVLLQSQHRGDVQTTLPKLDALEAPSAVREPVAIGSEKQLFVDRALISTTDNILLTVTPPERHPANPVLRPETPSDGQYLSPNGVWWNPDRKLFQLWYSALHFEHKEEHFPAYAESTDGIRWERPRVGVREFGGTRDNNLTEGAPGEIILDPRDPNPDRRYKRVTTEKGPDVAIWFSPDGIHWRASGRNPVLSPTGDTHTLLGWDERHRRYLGYFRPAGRPRRIGISFSSDAEDWTPVVPVLAPDDHDPIGTEFYVMRVIRYESIYLGIFAVLHLDRRMLDFRQPDAAGAEQTVDLQLAVSRDGVQWLRVGNRAPWFGLARYQSWDDMQLWPSTPIVVGDEIRFYYSGVSVRHQFPDLDYSGMKLDGRWRGGAIGLATLRRDGWVAVRPNIEGKGVLTTRLFTFAGRELEVNADARGGKIQVELLDAAGAPIAARQPAVLTGDSVRHRAGFGSPISELAGKPVRLRFTLERSKLYAFQFIP